MKALLPIFIIFFYVATAVSKDHQADSLNTLYAHSKNQQERMERCLNLDNYYRNVLSQDSMRLTEKLLDEGIKGKSGFIISDALRKLVMGVNRKNRVLTNDSIVEYLKIAEKNLKGERKRSFIAEVKLRHIRSLADWTTDESKTIKELTSQYTNSNDNSNDIYYQIERNYALGMAAALNISEGNDDTYKNAIRYFDRLFELIQKLPIKYSAEILFWVNENIYLSYYNSKEKEKVVHFVGKMMDMLNQYRELPEVKADRYQSYEYVYSLYYEGLSRFPSIVGHEKSFEALQNVDKMLRKRGDLISVYFSYKGFYEDLGEHKKMISYGDSIINYMKTSDVPAADFIISAVYHDQAGSYEALKDYKKAYELMCMHDELEVKITNGESKKLRADMDARYDLNQLELDKERLTSHNRQIAIILILIVFILSVAWGVTQRIHLNKLKRMQKKLVESNDEVIRQSEKAKESEKMKTAFINSMCHEIRTPLNAINGFSYLLLDDSIDAESKEEFPELIQKNTDLLTRLINDLIEVSNLSSSDDDLPTTEADLRVICTKELDKLKKAESKPDITYSLNIADDACLVCTNVPYLSMTLAHLLDNANKFTEKGEIYLDCHRESDGRLVISVADTGIGIPEDKQEVVFERFTKLDEFIPGSGLGLHICRLIMTRLGGTIHIDPATISGTTIILTLPSSR